MTSSAVPSGFTSAKHQFDDWWIRAFDFPRLQICVLGLLTGVGFLCFWDRTSLLETLSLGGLALCLFFQGSKMYPYTPFVSKQVLTVSADAPLSLLIANVMMENRQAQQLLQIVRDADPDLLLMVETDAGWVFSGWQAVYNRVCRLLCYGGVVPQMLALCRVEATSPHPRPREGLRCSRYSSSTPSWPSAVHSCAR